ncbi:MAG: valine--tRNA ligase [Bdellovibrionales bacterium]|nr:valine--tRNA ligase [Bdellovibrionales bacterium]
MELPDRYSPKDVEGRIYQWWMDRHYFKAQETSTKPPFSIILPPPNVTGKLHLGHALNHNIQDALARWKRMSGFNVLWLPGTDHAGIATQSVVERELKKEGTNRHALGREKFVERVWKWKEEYGGNIVDQMRRLGDSCDWDRLVFTLDEGVSKAVRKVFVDLHNKGLIYKGLRLINWSPALESAISDLEVDYKEVKGSIWHIRYPLADGSGEIVVATTRPETMLGDTAVAVHPDDERYQQWIGKEVQLPLTGRKIPVIADSYVDKEFGSGVVKITPAHDFNDYAVGQRHKLPMINILNKNGTLNEAAGAVYQGMKVADARKKVLEDLEAGSFLVKTEPHTHQVGHCSRTGCVVEPFLSEQWFVKMAPLAAPAKRVVESGTINFEPESWTKTYLHWMNIIQDWCISRQLWWGHRIPAWTCGGCQKIIVSETDPAQCPHCKSKDLKQEEDVLDTWFSSALWPFSTMGWPADTELQKTFYPTTVLVTGFDIIFFWVARMIVMGLEFKKDVPFRTVYIHGVIRDAQGKKMSKSTGNAEDPVQLIEEYGSDALRYTLLAQIAGGRDLKFSTQRLEGYRNFMNKIWNATRFSLNGLKDFEAPADGVEAVPNKVDLTDADQWLIYKLGVLEKDVDEALKDYRFSDAANGIYAFVWNIFCDWYLEFIKPIFQEGADPAQKKATQLVLAQVLNRVIRLLHPFAPFITEEIYQKLPIRGEALIVDSYPTPKIDKTLLALGSEEVALELDLVREVITAIRNIRGENRIKPGTKINVRLAPTEARAQKILGENKSSIMTMSRLETCEIGEAGNLAKCAVQPVQIGGMKVDVIIPLEGLVDIGEEVVRIRKNIEKLQKDVGSLTNRMADANFVSRAGEEVVAASKRQLEESQAQIGTLEAALARLM